MAQTPGLVRIICVGSLRNVAYAYHLNPALFEQKIEAVWFVGGTIRSPRKPGNVDANVLRDQVAADIIFNNAIPLVWIPCTLDRVMQFDARQETELRKMQTPVAKMLAESIDVWRAFRGKAFLERTHQTPDEGKRVWSTCANLSAADLQPEWMGYVRGRASFGPQRWTWFEEDPAGPDLMLVKRDEKAICDWVLEHFESLPLADK
jgi:inosine-uridine nucleoside N-ribohydrolase